VALWGLEPEAFVRLEGCRTQVSLQTTCCPMQTRLSREDRGDNATSVEYSSARIQLPVAAAYYQRSLPAYRHYELLIDTDVG
jgi:hypothetical protein